MATTAEFRKSVSELSPGEQLDHLIKLRAERRMIPEKKVKAKKKSAAKKPKKETVAVYLDNLGDEEKEAMLANLLEIKKRRQT